MFIKRDLYIFFYTYLNSNELNYLMFLEHRDTDTLRTVQSDRPGLAVGNNDKKLKYKTDTFTKQSSGNYGKKISK